MDKMPDFVKSPYFVPEFDNWHLKDGAPEEVVEEFNEYLERKKREKENGVYS